jgi:ubiquinone/menaquinone biosynthesis C-methylase UbiE
MVEGHDARFELIFDASGFRTQINTQKMTDNYEYRNKYKSREKAEQYDYRHFKSVRGRIFSFFETRQLENAFRLFRHNASILDMPCGTGRITVQLLNNGFRVVGGDISGAMVEVAQQKLQHYKNLIRFQLMDGTNIPYPDNTFDGAVCIRFMANIPLELQKTILKELVRVSAGPIIVGFSLTSRILRIRNRLKRLFKSPLTQYHVTDKIIDRWSADLNIRVSHRSSTIPLLSQQYVVVFESSAGV